jgi:electron transport complex protein RnfB
VEIKLLKKMFTVEQAELTMQLTTKPEPVSAIAERAGMDQDEVSEKLEQMAKDGLIFRVRGGEERLYQAFQFIVGLYEFQLNRLDREFCELFEEYLPYFKMSMGNAKTSQMRILPVETALHDHSQVAPYNQVRELVQNQEYAAVGQCICRKEQGLLDNPCEKIQETCLMFGSYAHFYVDNGLARVIDKEEVLSIIDKAEENGLVLNPTNSQRLEAICCCCSCCCPVLTAFKSFPNPGDIVTTYYRSAIDGDSCTGCGECIDICPMDAIEDNDGISRVLNERCIGCGLCVNRCPVEAITMENREDRTEAPPETFDEALEMIASERGVI